MEKRQAAAVDNFLQLRQFFGAERAARLVADARQNAVDSRLATVDCQFKHSKPRAE
jgi:hypothetical protein